MAVSSVARQYQFQAFQRRSLRTTQRLLDAAESILQERGLVGATVPRIARRAKVAVGSLYRRFPDKDAVLKAVYERYFERSRAGNIDALGSIQCDSMSAHQIVAGLVRSLIDNYVDQKRLLSALIQYADEHPDAKFRGRADLARRETFAAISALLLKRRDEIKHPDPERGIELALMVLGAALKEFVLKDRYLLEPNHLAVELTDLITRYLRIEADGSASR